MLMYFHTKESMDIDLELPQPTATVTAPILLPPTKSGRVRQFPSRYQDFLPNSRSQVPHLPVVPDPPAEVAPLPRKFIFEKGLGIKSKGVEGLLESRSYTPTRVCILLFIFYVH